MEAARTNKKTESEWAMHAALVGQIAAKATSMVSNTCKLKVLEAMTQIEKEARKEWAVANAQRTGTADW